MCCGLRGRCARTPSLPSYGTWDQVTLVTRSADGTQLVFHQGDERRLVLIGREVTSLESDVARYLDKNRGYGSMLG